MSFLALVGLRHPVRMLPVRLFESTWKMLWLGTVALPNAAAGTLDGAMREVAVSCAVVVVVLAVTPWRHMWESLVKEPGDRWR